MKNMKKILVFAMAMLLVMALSVTGTLAWLNSLTDEVTNTFTVGNVTITLDEGDVYDLAEQANDTTISDEDLGQHEPGVTKTENRVQANAYKLVPGKSYDKDPIVHIDANSENCYVFVKVVNTLVDIEAPDTAETPKIATQMAKNGWLPLTGADGNDVPNVFYYTGIAKANDHLTVFESFHIATNANVANAPSAVTIQAYAVQAEEFDTASEAWLACATDWQK